MLKYLDQVGILWIKKEIQFNIVSPRVQLKCLFPKDETCPSPDSYSLEEMKGSSFAENCCCPENTDKGENMSCTPLLAKTTHRTINK